MLRIVPIVTQLGNYWFTVSIQVWMDPKLAQRLTFLPSMPSITTYKKVMTNFHLEILPPFQNIRPKFKLLSCSQD